MITQNIRIFHPIHGLLLSENFVNPSQFKLFLKMLNGCLISDENLTFFNGTDFLINIPHVILKESVITTSLNSSVTEQLITKSKIEQPA
jgi:hypothetical protein